MRQFMRFALEVHLKSTRSYKSIYDKICKTSELNESNLFFSIGDI